MGNRDYMEVLMKKKLAIGISDFKMLIDNNCYYVDKSLLIKELLDDGSGVVLLPRPRRFGKTLNLSMLRYFFEKTDKNNKYLFKNLKISPIIESNINIPLLVSRRRFLSLPLSSKYPKSFQRKSRSGAEMAE